MGLYMVKNNSYLCFCPSGHYILMKVFSLLSRLEISQISNAQG